MGRTVFGCLTENQDGVIVSTYLPGLFSQRETQILSWYSNGMSLQCLFVPRAAKICNNLAMAVCMLGVSEALALGLSLGIEADTLTKVFNSSSARCWSSDSYNPVPGVMEGVPASRNYAGGFSSKLMAKDLNLAAASGEAAGVKRPLTPQALEIAP